MSTVQRRLHAVVNGRVQGVSFRYYTVLEARQQNIKGWVMNRNDGAVEILAEGTEATLQQLLEFLHRGSPSSQVDSVDETWEDATGEFSGFNVRYQ